MMDDKAKIARLQGYVAGSLLWVFFCLFILGVMLVGCGTPCGMFLSTDGKQVFYRCR